MNFKLTTEMIKAIEARMAKFEKMLGPEGEEETGDMTLLDMKI